MKVTVETHKETMIFEDVDSCSVSLHNMFVIIRFGGKVKYINVKDIYRIEADINS